jgi:hypothetical protein
MGSALAATWVRRDTYNLPQTVNRLVDISDFTPFDVPNPLIGETMPLYNLNPAKQGLVDLLDTTADRSIAGLHVVSAGPAIPTFNLVSSTVDSSQLTEPRRRRQRPADRELLTLNDATRTRKTPWPRELSENRGRVAFSF